MGRTQPGLHGQDNIFLIGLIQLPVIPEQSPFLIGEDIRSAAGYQIFRRSLKQSRDPDPLFKVGVGFPGQPLPERPKGNPDFTGNPLLGRVFFPYLILKSRLKIHYLHFMLKIAQICAIHP
jgi:hypothetical protein